MNPAIVLVLAALVVMLVNKNKQSGSNTTTTLSVSQMRAILVNWANANTTDSYNTRAYVIELFQSGMSDSEISYVYDYIFNYVNKGLRPAATSSLALQIQAISDKYQIFT
jgi:cytochrome c-type biogenesis protein CcmH/NrfF